MHALQGLCAQFEQRITPNGKPYFTEGDGELARARQLVRRSWNIARYSAIMFEQEAEIDAFNESL